MAGVPRKGPGRQRLAAQAVAEFVGARGDDLAFVDNATTGVNAVLRSFPFQPGDEILVTNLTYGAVANVAAFVARESGAIVRTLEVPYPAFDPDAYVDRVAAALGPRTRVAVVDHISAESALILPLAAIAARCRAKGVAVLVDGAHAPGQIHLDIPALGVDWYTGNLHKWAYSPRNCGFLWAAPERQAELHPPVISWGFDKGFLAEFDFVGTRDPSAYLAAPEGIAMLRELGLEAVRAYNHGLAWEGARMLSERFEMPLALREVSVGSMVTVPLPQGLGSSRDDAARLRDALLFEDRFEVQLHSTQGRLWVRVSTQVYNEMSDLERLADAIAART
jgi:isopenicillin-N epimerase